ncbi:hypothetical protein AKJ66_01250 [candidate division MSBL1 archaeon SCGC-AAA259E22]|uniref:histidine kinase n=1 Tax=candidate division MSBL1 archaeon SCGC-AAA259E22 TaxID=1698265 RepID=A0A133UHP1_9EURY|nr:hypothetical protein AKJ66_01250 [candidate division MSBL1 archaeon SCGC-AAA259E22]
MPFKYEGKKTYLSICRDITDRKEAEEKIRELSRFRERIIQDVDIWLNVLDKDANVQVWNKAAEEISGYSEEEVVGHDEIWEWLYPDEDYRREITEKVGDILKGEEIERYETIIQCKSGEEKVISWTSHPLRNEEGEIIGSIALGSDVTEQKEAEERKEFLNTLLRQDLRSKCQTLSGYLQLLEDADLSDEHREYLRKAVAAGREADEVLELARELEEIEETKWVAERDLVKVLEQVMEDISNLAESGNIEIEKNYSESIGSVKGDYSLNTLFSQILKTRIQTSGCDKIEIEAEKKNGKILVKVEDNGAGLSQDIVDLFSRKPYRGVTAGAGGARYYMIGEIGKHNQAEIKAHDSELGGARFDIHLEKA